jgi:secreted trypsin-like serine protease
MKKLVLALLVCPAMACAMDPVDESDQLNSDEQSIINGVVDVGDPSVVAVFAHAPGATSGSLCTGAVVAPQTVLTAAHCVDPRIVGPGQVFEVLTGTTLSVPGLPVSSTAFDPVFDPNNLFGGHDIGVVHLAQPTALASLPFNLNPTLFNLPVRLVGYGSNTHANTGAGTKRQVTTNPVAANALLVQIGNSNMQTCHGDSGGPAFQTLGGVETIIGVTSFGSDNSPTSVCFGGGIDTRVDAVAAFIFANLF